jgi:CheY-like chemotaxis protein
MSGHAEPTRSPDRQHGSTQAKIARSNPPFSEGWLNRQDRLEESAELVRRLAHDFSNVLTGILGFSELNLSLLGPDSPTCRYAQEIHQAAQQGAEFTQTLRWFSKRGGKSEHVCSLGNLLPAETLRMEQSGSSGVQWRIESAEVTPSVAVETDALRVLLRQLMTNAREAIPGAGFVTLATRSLTLGEAECRRLIGDAQPGSFVELSVADTGPGFSAEAKSRIFEGLFFSTKPRRRGLGLAVVYGVLRNCRGGISIEDGIDSGSVVRVYLPTALVGARTHCGTPAAPGQSTRVLVVDDDPGVLLLVCTTLEQAGYRVQAAKDGADALTHFLSAGSDGFALVLSDVYMPRISGIDLTRLLLEQDGRASVLLMSGEACSALDVGDALRGRFGLLSKPFRPEGLLRAVRAALQRRAPAAVADAGQSVSTPQCAST